MGRYPRITCTPNSYSMTSKGARSATLTVNHPSDFFDNHKRLRIVIPGYPADSSDLIFAVYVWNNYNASDTVPTLEHLSVYIDSTTSSDLVNTRSSRVYINGTKVLFGIEHKLTLSTNISLQGLASQTSVSSKNNMALSVTIAKPTNIEAEIGKTYAIRLSLMGSFT